MRQEFDRARRVIGHQPERGLESDNPTERRWNPHRPGSIRPLGQRSHPSCHCCRRTPARTASGPLEMPWIPGRPDETIAGIALPAEFRGIRLADDDRASSPQPLDDRRIRRSDAFHPEQRAARPAHTGDRCHVLDQHRHAEQRTPITVRVGVFGFERLLPRLLSRHRDEGMEPRVEPVDLLEYGIDDLDRRKGATTVLGEEFGRREKTQFESCRVHRSAPRVVIRWHATTPRHPSRSAATEVVVSAGLGRSTAPGHVAEQDGRAT
ncbi:hypothetical protein HRbin27_00015 [bacterium HR27]|nr:hypothetical protein HRbin27_00015 [bacterium HR27]